MNWHRHSLYRIILCIFSFDMISLRNKCVSLQNCLLQSMNIWLWYRFQIVIEFQMSRNKRNKDITKISLKNGTFVEEIAIKRDIVKVLHIQCYWTWFWQKNGTISQYNDTLIGSRKIKILVFMANGVYSLKNVNNLVVSSFKMKILCYGSYGNVKRLCTHFIYIYWKVHLFLFWLYRTLYERYSHFHWKFDLHSIKIYTTHVWHIQFRLTYIVFSHSIDYFFCLFFGLFNYGTEKEPMHFRIT